MIADKLQSDVMIFTLTHHGAVAYFFIPSKKFFLRSGTGFVYYHKLHKFNLQYFYNIFLQFL